jgi:hypothetical protein
MSGDGNRIAAMLRHRARPRLYRLRKLGIIKRVTRSCRYYLTLIGRAAIAAASRITHFAIIPALA